MLLKWFEDVPDATPCLHRTVVRMRHVDSNGRKAHTHFVDFCKPKHDYNYIVMVTKCPLPNVQGWCWWWWLRFLIPPACFKPQLFVFDVVGVDGGINLVTIVVAVIVLALIIVRVARFGCLNFVRGGGSDASHTWKDSVRM